MANSSMSQETSRAKSMAPQPGTSFQVIDEEIVRENQQLRRHIQKKHARQVFTLFPKLPKELQLGIIETALDAEVRIIEVQYKRKEGQSTYRSRTLVPGLMHTCRWIRREAMSARSVYDRFPTTGVTPCFKDTFVNWEKDIIFFHTLDNLRTFASTAPDMVKGNCKNLAIRLSDVGRFNKKVGWNGLGNIKKLVLLRQITNEPEKSRDLVIKELPNPNWPGVHQGAWEAAANFLMSSSDPSRALKDCIAVDATRDSELKRKSGAKKQRRGVLSEDGKDTLSVEDALLAVRQQEESAALFENFNPPDDPIFQDDFMIEEYDTDDGVDDTLDLLGPLAA